MAREMHRRGQSEVNPQQAQNWGSCDAQQTQEVKFWGEGAAPTNKGTCDSAGRILGLFSVPSQAPSIPNRVLPVPRAGCSPAGAALQRWPSLEAASQFQLGKTSERQIDSAGQLPPLAASALPCKTRAGPWDPTRARIPLQGKNGFRTDDDMRGGKAETRAGLKGY